MELTIDHGGVTGHGFVRDTRLAWDDIRDYRVSIRPNAGSNSWSRAAELARAALHDREVTPEVAFDGALFELRLLGERAKITRTAYGWSGLQSCRDVLPRLQRRLAPAATAAFERDGIARFGDLAITAAALQWKSHDPIAREQIESIQVFVSGRVTLRVEKRGAMFAYCAPRLEAIPNIGGFYDLAAALNFPVRSRALLTALGIVELPPPAPPNAHVL